LSRLNAACEQLGVSRTVAMNGLDRTRVFLSKRSLSDLAIWEPRSFKVSVTKSPDIPVKIDLVPYITPTHTFSFFQQAICHLGWKRAAEEGINGVRDLGDVPKGVITRGMLKSPI